MSKSKICKDCGGLGVKMIQRETNTQKAKFSLCYTCLGKGKIFLEDDKEERIFRSMN